VDEAERKRHLDTLEKTPARLKAALKGVPKKLLLWAPAPGKWSILEIVCHMRDMEEHAYLARYRRILAEDDPALPDIDGDQWALERDYRAQKLAEVLRDWLRVRKESLRLLKKVKGGQWSRRGIHEAAGPLTVEDFLRRQAAGNDEAHLGQIDAIKRRHTLLSRLESGPITLGVATRGLAEDAARRRPPDGTWAVVEHACHLRDLEQVFAERFTKMAHQEQPALWMMDNDKVAEARRYRDADLSGAAREFRRLREATVLLLRALPQSSWRRIGRHPTRGDVSIEQLAERLAEHDEHHLGAIRRLAGL
jgi:DinB superfamily